MFHFAKLNKLICSYMSESDRQRIAEAYIFGADAHETQIRSSGEPYFCHPVEVACILASVALDAETIIAGLLHDVVEDTEYTSEDIKEKFGEKVAELVEGVTKLTQIRHKNRKEQQAENFRKMILSVIKDVRVIFIKLADRLHNMRTLAPLKPEKKRRVSLETLEVFAPLAHRLGINILKENLETLAFEGIHPLRYRILEEQVLKVEKNKEKVFIEVKEALKQKLGNMIFDDNCIKGRKKTLYSIYNKMKNKGTAFSDIMDMYAYKVIVPKKIDCYVALGKIHELYKPVPQRFKDYIATPKTNGYKSLHTVVFGPYNIPIEIQIKTQRMDESAEFGVAAHWSYKSGEKNDKSLRKWLSKISDMQVYTASSVEFLENVKNDLFNNDVYVFTPNGEIIELPNNSTCVDFAYYIHTDVGNRCLSAKVNRKKVPLNYILKQGDSVEIITSPIANPSESWLDFVTTGRAKSGIKSYIKDQTQNQSYIYGKNVITDKLAQYNINIENIPVEILNEALFNYENIETVNRFYLDVGLGLVEIDNFINFIIKYTSDDKKIQKAKEEKLVIKIKDGEDIRIADCCLPIPGDDIRAIIKPGEGVKIHRSSCNIAYRELISKRAKEVFAKWGTSEETSQTQFKARIAITFLNSSGAIAKITTSLARQDVNIRNFKVLTMDQEMATLEAIITISKPEELYSVTKTLRRLNIVVSAERLLNI